MILAPPRTFRGECAECTTTEKVEQLDIWRFNSVSNVALKNVEV
jgi:hypothetical protein